MRHYATIQNTAGQQIDIPLLREGTREVGVLLIDGVRYHVERMKEKTLQRQYRVDADRDYTPQCDGRGRCVIVAPYSRR